MSLITEHGRRERQRIDEAVAELSRKVLETVGEREVPLADLLSADSAQSPELTREAIWKLLDERKLQFTVTRRLRRTRT